MYTTNGLRKLVLPAMLGLSLLIGMHTQATAAIIFQDNFDASVSGLNVVPTGWSVSDGTVDVVGGGFCVSELCVDLDGSSGNAGVLSRTFSLTGAVAYSLSFDLSGNKRRGTDDVLVTFGASTLPFIGLPAAASYTKYSLAFTPTNDGQFSISFANAGGDNVGALLDNVMITSSEPGNQVPEPQGLALVLAALAAMGVVARRKSAG